MELDCVCGHLAHDDECPERVGPRGATFPCGCDDYVPSRYDSTAVAQCPACGSHDHDGWTDHTNCPEDWTVLSNLETRRHIQLLCERHNANLGQPGE